MNIFAPLVHNFAHNGHSHSNEEVAAASTTLDTTSLVLFIVAGVLVIAAIFLIVFVRASVKRVKQLDGNVKTQKADPANNTHHKS